MDANQPEKSYTSITINGPVSVKPVERITDRDNEGIVLLLGPTGSGKSSFIEALAPKGSLQISSHLLEGCTQSISPYRVENVTSVVNHGMAIYVVDVPGFGDTKISEMSVVSMIKEWLQKMGIANVGRILYFTPINVVRLPGSQRQMLKTFQSLTGTKAAENVMIISTMWDLLSGESSIHRAQRNFEQLRDVIWKDYIERGTRLVKFHNTPESVLSILDDACQTIFPVQFHIEAAKSIHRAEFGEDLYNNLQIRIQNLHIERANVLSELEGARLRADAQLVKTVSLQLEETERLLAKFGKELEDFGPAPKSLREANVQPSVDDLQPADTLPEVHGRELTIPSHLTPAIGQPLEDFHQPAGTHPNSAEPNPSSHPNPAKRGFIAMTVASLKCWGQDVRERHDL